MLKEDIIVSLLEDIIISLFLVPMVVRKQEPKKKDRFLLIIFIIFGLPK